MKYANEEKLTWSCTIESEKRQHGNNGKLVSYVTWNIDVGNENLLQLNHFGSTFVLLSKSYSAQSSKSKCNNKNTYKYLEN